MTSKPHVTFYTKPGCHLCEDARREIESAGCDDRYTFEEVNILSDPELRRRYANDIPVILVNGVYTFKHRLTAADFRDAVEKHSRSAG